MNPGDFVSGGDSAYCVNLLCVIEPSSHPYLASKKEIVLLLSSPVLLSNGIICPLPFLIHHSFMPLYPSSEVLFPVKLIKPTVPFFVFQYTLIINCNMQSIIVWVMQYFLL